jgi:hypothetical protein
MKATRKRGKPTIREEKTVTNETPNTPGLSETELRETKVDDLRERQGPWASRERPR